jgi:hypothetical protein
MPPTFSLLHLFSLSLAILFLSLVFFHMPKFMQLCIIAIAFAAASTLSRRAPREQQEDRP